MKKFLLMATAVGVAFTSCVNDNEAVYQQEENPQPITFEVAKYKAASRAEGDGTQTQAEGDGTVVFSTDHTFGTFAYELAYGTNAHITFMDNVEIKHYAVDGSKGYWAAAPKTTVNDETGESTTTTPKYTWPTNAHLDFISYYPYSIEKTASSVPQVDATQGTFEYKGFVVDANNPVDLMYSDKAVYQTANTQHYGYVGVPTLFRHALAKLNFLVKAQKLNNHKDAVSDAHKLEWEVTLNEICIDNIFKKGSMKMNLVAQESDVATTIQWKNSFLTDDNNQNDADVWDVDRTDGVEMAKKTWTQNQKLTTTATRYTVRASAEDGGGIKDETKDYFVMPQLLKGTQTITIKYTVKTIDGTNESSETFEKTLKFNEVSTTVTSWERGKNITYTIEIDPEGDIINFAPAIYDWEALGGTISI